MSASKERLAATLAGEPVDRPPVSIWRHNFLREWSADDLADETLALYGKFDWDLIKLNPRWSYLPEAFGNRYEPPSEQRFQKVRHAVVREAADLDRLEPADPNHPSLVEQLDALEAVVRAVGHEVDVIHTVFSPLSVVGLLTGGLAEPLLTYGRENPAGLQHALGLARDVVEAHVAAALDRGAAGIFYAPTQWTSLDFCDADFYARFGRPHDLALLAAAEDAPIRVIHICGDRIDAARFYDYPANLLSWDDRGRENPTLEAVAGKTGKAVMGGVPHKRIHKLDPGEIGAAMRAAPGALDRGFVLAGGCAVGALIDDDRLRAVRDASEDWSAA